MDNLYLAVLTQMLKCSVCFKLPQGIYIICANHHAVCENCVPRGKWAACSTCDVTYPKWKTRNFLAEAVLIALPFDCPFKGVGCPVRCTWRDTHFVAHADVCRYNPANGHHWINFCQILGLPCFHMMYMYDIPAAITHMMEAHGIKLKHLDDKGRGEVVIKNFHQFEPTPFEEGKQWALKPIMFVGKNKFEVFCMVPFFMRSMDGNVNLAIGCVLMHSVRCPNLRIMHYFKRYSRTWSPCLPGGFHPFQSLKDVIQIFSFPLAEESMKLVKDLYTSHKHGIVKFRFVAFNGDMTLDNIEKSRKALISK